MTAVEQRVRVRAHSLATGGRPSRHSRHVSSLRLVVLFLFGCTPREETCLVRSTSGLNEEQATALVDAGMVLVGVTPECSEVCVRDGTVTPGPPLEIPLGYCAASCGPGCPAGTVCREVGSHLACLRTE